LRRTKGEWGATQASKLHSRPAFGSVDMSQNNPIRVFVTHAWEVSDDYLRIFEYLESARNFFYKNLSAPDKAPAGGGKEDHDRSSLNPLVASPGTVSETSGSVPRRKTGLGE